MIKDIDIKRIKEKKQKLTTEQELFALEYRLACLYYGINQKEMAKRLGIHFVNISEAMNGKKAQDYTYKLYRDKLGAYMADNYS